MNEPINETVALRWYDVLLTIFPLNERVPFTAWKKSWPTFVGVRFPINDSVAANVRLVVFNNEPTKDTTPLRLFNVFFINTDVEKLDSGKPAPLL